MRFVVSYRKPDNVVGRQLFDMDADMVTDTVIATGADVAGEGAFDVVVRPNDGRADLGEWVVPPDAA